MINGIINVYKEKGYTSHDVVAKLRGILKQKKIGHTGTLDPDAEGVLPVCLGNATKLCDILTDKSKAYRAVLLLGITTDTQDITGKVMEERAVTAGKEEILEAILSFRGSYDQIPPMYSALKVGGKRLYELAREGKEIPRESRKVELHSITVESLDMNTKEAVIVVECSKGTYIRTLCHDIGEKLLCGGCMKALTRIRSGEFDITESLKLGEIETEYKNGTLDEHVKSVPAMFPEYECVTVKKEFDKQLYNGNFLVLNQLEQEKINVSNNKVLVYDGENNFVGIYEYCPEQEIIKPYKMFL
ncbi:tRNA pseudouridine(55) synthase TruB [Anaerocolumna chitinilytica]|uniref:tRNA pseudouridine synthase B n=1 Tax=Anaerocolumna chitinilytica TaxID=1727145 RepID=A0A7I8DNY9_9FIRM|nr:tRNA pseudouridine(55) synthase TruB [Anaerocolumna chitinilytica]BCK00100.1 tRNA pseudouridine synthase B [Anaerocolumna chitinilytica]